MTYTEPVGEKWRYDPAYHRICDYLEVDRNERQSYDIAKKVFYLADHVGINAKSSNVTDVMVKIQKMKKDLGTMQIGKNLVNYLYQHVRLQSDAQKLKDQRAVEKKEQAELKKEDKKVQEKEDPAAVYKEKQDETKREGTPNVLPDVNKPKYTPVDLYGLNF